MTPYKTSNVYIILYFLELTLKILRHWNLLKNKRNHIAIWNQVKQFDRKIVYSRKTRISAFLIDKTMIQIGYNDAWLWLQLNIFVEWF